MTSLLFKRILWLLSRMTAYADATIRNDVTIYITLCATVKQGKKENCRHTLYVAAGAHLPTPWLFESAKRPDDRADYCLDLSFLL